MGGDQGTMRGLVFADLRKVQHHHLGRPEDDGAGQRGWARIAGWQIVGGTVLPDCLDPARLRVGDRDKAELDLAAVMREADYIGWVQRQPRGRQAEGGAFPADPGFHQRAAAAAFGLLGRDRYWEAFRGNARRVDGDPAGFHKGGVVILVRPRDLPLQRLRQFGLLDRTPEAGDVDQRLIKPSAQAEVTHERGE